MPNFNGTCSSKVQSQTTMEVPGPMNRQVGVAMMLGKHKCAVPQWNDARMTYVRTTDSVDGTGEQHGYFHNVHSNGDTSFGTFEAKVSMTDAPTVEGTWRFTGGTGSLAKLSGGGPFKAQMTSPTDSEMTWSGSYELS
jgi:hypothetical protein